jgi:esterase/lipase superfamily enzyme
LGRLGLGRLGLGIIRNVSGHGALKGGLTNGLRLAGMVLVLVISGCAGRPGPEVLRTVEPVPESSQVTVFTATTRALASQDTIEFTPDRSHSLTYARFAVSIPPTHVPSNIEWPHGHPDPSTSFAVVDQTFLPREAFLQQVGTASRAAGRGVGIFVHGFNHSFPETLFRLAQLSADAGLEAPQIAFAWPSQATLRGYLDDKNSATYSRDYLAEVIADLAAQETGEITIVGHSMGAWLVMEALRQLRLEGHHRAVDRLRVILAAPDIDVDVFRRQLEVIGPLSSPLMVLVSPDDRALLVSQWLAASRPRTGSFDVRDPEVQAAAQAANVQIVDISAVADTGGVGHDRYIALATTIPHHDTAADTGPLGDIRQAGVFILDAVGATISAPFGLAGQALAGE